MVYLNSIVGNIIDTGYPITDKSKSKNVNSPSGNNGCPPDGPVPPKSGKGDNTGKLLLGIGAAALAASILAAGKKAQISRIENRFAELYNDIPACQKTFQDVFMRDISEEETVEMLKRYEQIEKNGLHQTKEEYINAVYEEAVRNYGLQDFGIKFIIEEFPDEPEKGGFWRAADKSVHVSPRFDKKSLFGSIHHELRHAKQSETTQYLCKEDLIPLVPKVIGDVYELMKIGKSKELENGITKEQYIENVVNNEEHFNNFVKWTYRAITRRDEALKTKEELLEAGVPLEKIEYAKQMTSGNINYVNGSENFETYWKNEIERDARFAEDSIVKMIFGSLSYDRRRLNIKYGEV